MNFIPFNPYTAQNGSFRQGMNVDGGFPFSPAPCRFLTQTATNPSTWAINFWLFGERDIKEFDTFLKNLDEAVFNITVESTVENSHSIHGTPEDERGANFSLIAENRK